jgi:hypothetical protein
MVFDDLVDAPVLTDVSALSRLYDFGRGLRLGYCPKSALVKDQRCIKIPRSLHVRENQGVIACLLHRRNEFFTANIN